jgi:hypothetical protein
LETKALRAVFCRPAQVYKYAVTDYTLSVRQRRDPSEDKNGKEQKQKTRTTDSAGSKQGE